jgi:hypothetical protein
LNVLDAKPANKLCLLLQKIFASVDLGSHPGDNHIEQERVLPDIAAVCDYLLRAAQVDLGYIF